MSDRRTRMIMSINDMQSVALKLFNDAATICFHCQKRDGTNAVDEVCPSACGALTAIHCARDIVGSIETRDQVCKAS